MRGNGSFQLDMEKIQQDARKNIEEGALTEGHQIETQTILRLLDSALATEMVCYLRYTQNAIVAEELGADVVAREFREHAAEEADHAERLTKRISLLGGTPRLDPETFKERAHSQYAEFSSSSPEVLTDMLKENLVAERIAIVTYQEIVRYIGDKDPTTRRLFEDLLAVEEEHADEINALWQKYRRIGESISSPQGSI